MEILLILTVFIKKNNIIFLPIFVYISLPVDTSPANQS